MIMPDGEIVPLPADSSGLTMFPEIGQENIGQGRRTRWKSRNCVSC